MRFFFANKENCKIRAVGTNGCKGQLFSFILKGMKLRTAPFKVFGLFLVTLIFLDFPTALKMHNAVKRSRQNCRLAKYLQFSSLFMLLCLLKARKIESYFHFPLDFLKNNEFIVRNFVQFYRHSK